MSSPAAEWFLHLQGETIGPIALPVVGALLRCARLLPSDLVWTEGMKSWERAGNLGELASFLPSIPRIPVPNPPLPVRRRPIDSPHDALTEAIEIEADKRGPDGTMRRFWVLRMARVRVEGVAEIEGHGEFPIHDLSGSGVFLVSSTPIAIGTQVRCRLQSRELARDIQLTGEVVRIGKSQGGNVGFAIRFDGPGAFELDLIQQLVKMKSGSPI